MKALLKSRAGPGLALSEVHTPCAGPRDVLIKVLRTGICGTDLHIAAWDDWAAAAVETPRVLGHEFVGEVVEVGTDVTVVAPQDLVSGEGHLVCGSCRNCMAGRRHLCIRTAGLGVHIDGAFAEYVRLPASNVWKHPGPIDLDVAAIFDPFGNAVHTALAYPVVGEDVLITGAGPIGLMAAAVVKHAGARHVVVTDVHPSRLRLAREIGVDLALDVRDSSIGDAQRALGMKEGFDVALEMSGQPTALRDLISNMTHGGRVAVLGLPTADVPIDMTNVVTRMLTIKGIYGREMFETWYAMSALLERGLDLGAVITNRFGFEQHAEAFETARSGDGGKVVIDWTRPMID